MLSERLQEEEEEQGECTPPDMHISSRQAAEPLKDDIFGAVLSEWVRCAQYVEAAGDGMRNRQ